MRSTVRGREGQGWSRWNKCRRADKRAVEKLTKLVELNSAGIPGLYKLQKTSSLLDHF